MTAEGSWAKWWKTRGQDELALILWAAWDPIGAGVPRDEYDSYAPRVAGELRSGAPVEGIASMLSEFRTKAMGLPTDHVADTVAAEKIWEWYHHPWYGTGYPRPADLT